VSDLHVAVAGCPFAITPAEELSREERTALTRLSSDVTGQRVFTIHLDDSIGTGGPRDGQPAAITTEGGYVRVAHSRFAAVIDPLAYRASLHRQDRSNAVAIEVTLRTALGCRLPLESGMLLHTAGIVIDDGAYLFYGPSGAGKSTLAGFMKNVLSDELVAVQHGMARATGFWGTLDAIDAPAGTYPLRATIELARLRGSEVSLTSVDVRSARKALLLVAVVPPHQQLWMHALEVIDSLARLPAYRLEWTPSRENADRVVTALRSRTP
jgi:hypothetical protein